MRKKRILVCSILSVFAVAFFLIASHKNTVVYKGSLDETQQMVFAYLGVNASDFSASKTTLASSTNSPLYKLVDYILHVSTEKRFFSESLSIVAEHKYNIGGTGGMMIRFEMMPVDDKRTRVTVRFKNSWVGIWPPFVWWSPGIIIRCRIANSLECFIHEFRASP